MSVLFRVFSALKLFTCVKWLLQSYSDIRIKICASRFEVVGVNPLHLNQRVGKLDIINLTKRTTNPFLRSGNAAARCGMGLRHHFSAAPHALGTRLPESGRVMSGSPPVRLKDSRLNPQRHSLFRQSGKETCVLTS